MLLLLLPLCGHGRAERVGSRRRLPAGLEEFGEILLSSCSPKLEATLPQLSPTDLAALLQPPTRMPPSLLLRELDDASPPSGLVPGGLVTAVGRGSASEWSLRAACSHSSAATPGGRRRLVAETPRSLLQSNLL
jgi:hypothetical protein